MGFSFYNPNPARRQVGDCPVRAICKATGKSWDEVYVALALHGFEVGDMPSANAVWGAYLNQLGYVRHGVPSSNPDTYTVAEFARDHPIGTYILALATHVVCVRDGDWFDTWNSGSQTPLYFWERNESECMDSTKRR